jgi:hypothetical protein
MERDPTFWKSQGKVLEKFRNFSETTTDDAGMRK